MSKGSKIDQIHIRAVMLCMSKMSKILKQAITDFLEFISLLSKMSKINQIHLKTVMLCMSNMEKEHTHTLLLTTFLIFNQFSIHKKF